MLNTKIDGYQNDYALNFHTSYSSSYKLSLNLTSSTFGGGAAVNLDSGGMSLVSSDADFTGGKSTNCGINLAGGTAQLTRTSFDGFAGAPALCVTGSATATVVDSSFKHNVGDTAKGAAVYVSGAVFAASNTVFSSNQNTAANSEGAGIHCESSKLTVGSSTLQYNKAPLSAAASCVNCVVVAFGNSVSRNSDGASGGDACSL